MRPTPSASLGQPPWKYTAFVGLMAAWFALLPAICGASERRRTPIVEAVESARHSIVNINGQKMIRDEDSLDRKKRVNGMGTGVVVDERGYIVTNHHVIEGVRQIQVTLEDGRTHIARLIARDPQTDLAVIKINTGRSLPLIRIGTSRDLMPGEPVIAVGNAYGYHHTVTRGIISALNRAVEVTDVQKYFDLIQTDASINPGNSGGPLLNVDGEMIGINVAVRVGAQGIGFAIPVDKAMDVAARLISSERLTGTWHGIEGSVQVRNGVHRFVVSNVASDSPAAASGIKAGDIISAIGKTKIRRQLDVERAMLGLRSGADLSIAVRSKSGTKDMNLTLASAQRTRLTSAIATSENEIVDDAWDKLGVRLMPVSGREMGNTDSAYNGGLRVTELRGGSISERNGIRSGDVIVGMHVWETISLDNLDYVLNRADIDARQMKFYLIRGAETHVGHLPLTWR